MEVEMLRTKLNEIAVMILSTDNDAEKKALEEQRSELIRSEMRENRDSHPEFVDMFNAWHLFAGAVDKVTKLVEVAVKDFFGLDLKWLPINTSYEDKTIICVVNLGNIDLRARDFQLFREALGYPDYTLTPTVNEDGNAEMVFKFDVLSSEFLFGYDAAQHYSVPFDNLEDEDDLPPDDAIPYIEEEEPFPSFTAEDDPELYDENEIISKKENPAKKRKPRRKAKRVPRSREQEVVDAYNAGTSLKEMRAKFNTSDDIIYRILKDHDIKPNRVQKYGNLQYNKKSYAVEL